MPGSPGSFTRDHNWTADAGAGIKILASRHDEEDDNLAAGINAAIAHDGSNAYSGNADIGDNQIKNVAAGTVADDAPNIAQIQAGGLVYAADTGAADAYVIALSPAETAYATGMIVHFKPANDNTGASTINVNAIGVKNIKRQDGSDPNAGDIDATGITSLIYDGTNFVLIGAPPVSASDTAEGVIETATQAEMETATDTDRAVVPGRVQYHPGVAKAWVKFGMTGTISGSYGVSSVTDNGTGDFSPNWSTNFSSNNYGLSSNVLMGSIGDRGTIFIDQDVSSCRVNIHVSGAATESNVTSCYVTAHGDQ